MYPQLFRPGKIGKLAIKNRIVMPGMATLQGDAFGYVTEATIRYYEARARGGVGLIITEYAYVEEETGRATPNQLSLTNLSSSLGIQRLARAVHRYDTKLFVQICHPGQGAFPALLAPACDPIGPSEGKTRDGRRVRAMTVEEIQALVKKFVQGAVYAQLGEADGVEIHAAHVYLLSTFLSPHLNHRTDAYGGSPENRARFLVEIIRGIKTACGPDFPVSVRLNGCDFVEGGTKLEDARQTARILEAAGADALNISNSTVFAEKPIIEPVFYDQGWKKGLAKSIREVVSIPVLAVNTIKEPRFAEQLLEEGVSDFIGIARQSLADPEWSRKSMEGREGEIRNCISCLYCTESESKLKSITCAVNPWTGREAELAPLKVDGAGRLVVVLGGGVAGMQAASILAQRGFEVRLFEKKAYLGGEAHHASLAPKKSKTQTIVQNLEAELTRYGVQVQLEASPSLEEIQALSPYAIFVSIGAKPIVPARLPGIQSAHVYTLADIFDQKVKLRGKRILVAGGGLSAMDVATYLADNNEIEVIEMQEEIGRGVFAPFLQEELKQVAIHPTVHLHPATRLVSIQAESVTVEDLHTKKEREIPVDAVILSLGVRADEVELAAYRQAFPRVRFMGAVRAGKGRIGLALHDGFEQAYTLD